LAPAVAFGSAHAFRTLVVVNTNSADSVELGAYYAEQHGIPDHQICSVGIATNLTTLTPIQFRNWLRNPIYAHLAAEDLEGRIDFVVLCQDFPTRIDDTEGIAAALFYGFQDAPRYAEEGCNLPEGTSNEFFRAERAFRSADGWNATNGFVAFHLVASNLPTAKLVADRGAAAQSSFPPATINLHIYGSAGRSVREARYANVHFAFAALPGLPATCLLGPYLQYLNGNTNAMGYHDGFAALPLALRTNNVWLPGAYADHLTSLGGCLPTNVLKQSTVLDWMDVGATASYGAVDEPCNYLEKFPDPLLGFWYARGFTIGEAYAMAVEAPYQGLFAGDPLAAPFAAPPVVSNLSHAPYQIVAGTVPVQVSAGARSNGAPAARIDFYLDGRFQTTLAALGPTPSNVLSVAVGTRTNSAGVATNATLFDAVAALADAVNDDTNQIAFARARGDRLELIYKNFDHAGDGVPVQAGVSENMAEGLTLGVGAAAPHLVPSAYFARKRLFLFAHTNGLPTSVANAGDAITLQITLTNGVAVTNVIVAGAGEKITNLLLRLQLAVNTNALLQATNGVRYTYLANGLVNVLNDGTLVARTPGPDGWGIQVEYEVAPVTTNYGLRTNDSFSSFMDDNPDDVRPRASVLFHVRPSNDVLAATAELDTTTLADGRHDLDFIVRDGSAVAAATRHALPLFVANTSLVLTVESEAGAADPPAGMHAYPFGTALTNSVAAPPPAGGTQLVCTGWTLAGNDPGSGIGTNFTTTLTNHATLTWNWLPIPTDWFAAYGLTDDLAAAAWTDAEPDGFFTWQEYVADTDPTNAVSQPLMAFVETFQTNAPILTWPFSTGRLYSIQWSDDVVVGQWTGQALGLGVGEWTDTNPPPATSRWYRIAPQIP
jgi:uncharacterized protein (TIGR03790 family)